MTIEAFEIEKIESISLLDVKKNLMKIKTSLTLKSY